MTNLQRLFNKYNLLIIISMIVKNYNKALPTASEQRHNCGIKLAIFYINPDKNSISLLYLE